MTGWEALLDPGKATDYFRSRATLPEFEPGHGDWSLANAWWLAELSRLVYRRDGRPEFLAEVGLREVRFFDRRSTQCGWWVSEDPGQEFAVLVFRGTENWRDWLVNLRAIPADWDAGGHVHRGFRSGLRRVWSDVEATLAAAQVPVFVTGHSLGGALATLVASLWPVVAAYTFGAPRVGDAAFVKTLQAPLHRVVHGRDLVPSLPPALGRDPFAHGGVRHALSAAIESEPEAETGWRDRKRFLDPKRWIEPHPMLGDHAPVQYVGELARLLP